MWQRLILACGLAAHLAAAEGVTANSILIGQCVALDGPAKALGVNMQLGLQSAFAEMNAAGGVNGRQLTLQSVDDLSLIHI